MTRQHFAAVARAIAFSKDEMTPEAHKALANRMASELAAFNANFNRATFLKACGVEG